MQGKTATIILNRNLPNVTNSLVEHLQKFDSENTDIFVVESGSDEDKLSDYCTWYANWDDAILSGLRYARGMNYGLSNLWKEGKFYNYESFFLISNDTVLSPKETIKPLQEILKEHPRVGILSPCSTQWGEYQLLNKKDTLYFWFIHNNAYFLRREFIESILDRDRSNYMHFLFDGTNFRGYGLEQELIAKAYINNWSAAITRKVISSENESYLLNKSDLIKTEPFESNLRLYLDEGKKWMKSKYGFNSHWSMQQYSKCFYDLFFEANPEYINFKL